MRQMIFITALSLLLIGCKQNLTFLPGFEFGQSEAEWKAHRTSLVKDSVLKTRTLLFDTLYHYMWNLGDTSLNVKVHFNNDRVGDGSFRKYSFNLATEYTAEYENVNPFSRPFFYGWFTGHYCRAHTFDKVKGVLDQRLGKPTSVTTEDRGYYQDTSYWYKSEAFDVQLSRSPLNSPIQGMSSGFYTDATVTVYKKDYQEELDALVKSSRDKLRPGDVVSIEFAPPKLVKEQHENGLVYPALRLYSVEEKATSIFEDRTIAGVKGDLLIKDRFGDALFTWKDLEYNPNEPIKPITHKVSLAKPLEYGKSWTLFLVDRPETQKLREAVSFEKEMRVEFKPTAVYYTDGSTLK